MDDDTYIGLYDLMKSRYYGWHILERDTTEEMVREWARMFPNQIYFFLNINQEV